MEDDHVETQLLFASFDGRSVLHELSEYLGGLNAIHEHLVALELNSGRDPSDQRIYDNTLRRMFYEFNYRRLNFGENRELP